ncbi:MAG: helix-turn-helix domain-containing protein [Pseudonocardia sp.]|nr:helix-turn-helix domain-containing protein [Pseudonocardia sp.]
MTPTQCRVGPFPDVGSGSGFRTATSAATHVTGWRDMLREHFVALDVTDADVDSPFASEVRSTLLGNLSASEVRSAPQSCVRTGRLARDGDAYLQVGILARGRAVVEQDGREAALEPGRFVVYETDRPFTWHFPDPWQLLVLTWPRHLVDLGADASRAATARTLGEDRLGGIIGRTLTEIVLRPPELVDDGHRLAGELAALVGMMLGTHDDDGPVSTAGAADLRRRVASYVADHVEDPDLGVESIARAHFVSVRGLHRAFAGAGLTVGSLIRRLRLAHARQRLTSPRDAHLSVTEIAHACGFADLPTFSHGFKQVYHESPSTYRRRSGLPMR